MRLLVILPHSQQFDVTVSFVQALWDSGGGAASGSRQILAGPDSEATATEPLVLLEHYNGLPHDAQYIANGGSR